MEIKPVQQWSQVPYNAMVFVTLKEKNIPNMMIQARYLPKTTVMWSDVTKLEKESKSETVTHEELITKFKPISYIVDSDPNTREMNFTFYCGKQMVCVMDITNEQPICFKCKKPMKRNN